MKLIKATLLLFLPLGMLVSCQPADTSSTASPESSVSSTTSSSSSLESSSESSPSYEIIDSDDPGTATIEIFRQEGDGEDCYIAPRNVGIDITYEVLSGTLSNNQTVCPSTGDVNLLVIPVHLPGETNNTDQVLSDINEAFFGNQEDGRLGYKGLSEYYYESSFGKLNFSGTVTNWFDVEENMGITDSDDISSDPYSDVSVRGILRSAVAWAIEEQNIDIDEYDANDDGYIDAVWLVYDRLDTFSENAIEGTSDYNTIFWNMTGWDYDSYKSEEEIEEQIAWGRGTSAFSWASFSSLYTGYCEMKDDSIPVLDDYSSIPVDTHTLIHETGHLLGLEDYYATDSSVYRPAGQYTMMDQNVGDIDTYSKIVLGWVTPYVVYGPSSILLQKRSVNDHQAIVIPSNYEEINEEVLRQLNLGISPSDVKITFNPFSEYILIDLYSPDGLDQQDVYGPLVNGREAGPDATGIRVYHIDSRIFKCTVLTISGNQQLLFDPDNYIWDGETLNSNQAIFMPITNAVGTGNIDVDSSLGAELGVSFNSMDQIRLIEATGRDTFSNGEVMSEETLFYLDDEFSMSEFGMIFFQGRYSYNGGEDFPFTVKVKTLRE